MTNNEFRIILLGAIALAVGVNAFFFFRWSPRSLVAAWTLVLFLVPIWVGVQAGIFYSAITVMTLMIIATSTLRNFHLSIVDVLIISFTFLVIILWMFGWILWGHLVIVLFGWIVPYAGGRLISSRVGLPWIYSALAIGTVIASLLAVVEFLSGVNIFVGIHANNALFNVWHDLQYRGGLLRVEGAFGHSIALGACLAMGSVFVLVARWPVWLRALSLLLVMVAVGMTFSRIGVIGIAITIVVALIALGPQIPANVRKIVTVMTIVVATIGVPLLLDVFSSAGQEASGSAEYRSSLFSLFSSVSLLGITPTWTVSPNGQTYYGGFQSIDSEMILTALRLGLVPLVLVIAALACCVISVLRGRGTPSSVAIIGMIPGFATVALITQYATFVWFLAGLAVASHALTPGRTANSVHIKDRIAVSSWKRKDQAWLP
ncbi:hypothetical protein [Arthrobacter cryoconiti]|uniref:Uncharacterized protein n=1 Tax=Arthrobacter cryoconiti TaxID=748907 RepID=A0ABV8R4B4_9MICC|nr:hypothetical protein [Arthrobacter cryoconiti]MCC9067020.1 hypothetical protein [Arthrobacter cryoconiti]